MIITRLSDHDFGFSFSDGTDLPEMTKAVSNAETTMKSTNEKFETLLALMNSLLDNLSKEPNKKYLLWPDRAVKIKMFRDKINNLVN